MTAPCYVCGAEAVIDGLCADCYAKAHPLMAVDTPLTLLICRRCGAVKVAGGWHSLVPRPSNADDMLDRQIDVLLSREVHLSNPHIEVGLTVLNRLDRVLITEIEATGRSHPDLPVHTERLPLEIRLHYATCDTCGMMSGGYYESILQIRADGRSMTDEEVDQIVEIVTQRTIAEYGKDVKAFVTGTSRTKYGIDFQIGSEHLSRKIADELESLFLAERKENYKLVTQDRGGKRKYRVTILLRLPRYHQGDFISVSDHPCWILSLGKGGVSCFDLVEQSRFTVGPRSAKWRTIQYLGSASDFREFSVIAKGYNQPYHLMDSVTFETIEVEATESLSSVQVGDTVRAFPYEGKLFFLPPQEFIDE
ncbi:MAG: hypothetical protein K9W43_00800 [Candidatus Thorarchaeota archaeon]|nr:hypothetical protein [Candidatus Thorarchaeota archaeon]